MESGLIRKIQDGVKILGDGALQTQLTVKAPSSLNQPLRRLRSRR